MTAQERQDKIDVYNRIELSAKALLGNIDFFRKRTGLQVIPVVKSNAYGHGISEVTSAIGSENFPCITVNNYSEAVAVRNITKIPILIMGMIKPENFKNVETRNLAFAVHDEATINALGSLGEKINIHLDIDSGMNRYGIDPEKLSDYLSLIKSYPTLELEGVMTHLADPDGLDDDSIIEATDIFDRSVEMTLKAGFNPKIIHIGQSASSLRLKSKYANASRIGLSLYGINPFSRDHPLYSKFKENLKPVLKLITTISRINDLEKGDGVSYNYTFRANKPMKAGVLPLGYYEGIDWRLGNKGMVKFKDQFIPIIGKVCMNHTMVDLTDVLANVGDEIIVFSDNPDDPNSFNQIAERYGLFVYSLLTSLAPDIRRVLV